MTAQVCGFFLACRSWSINGHPLSLLELALGMYSGVHTKSWQLSEVRCEFGAWGIAGCMQLGEGFLEQFVSKFPAKVLKQMPANVFL